MRNPFRYFNSSPAVIRTAVLLYIRFTLSLRQVEDLLHERGIDISQETVRFWWNRLGPVFAAELRNKQRKTAHQHVQWRWHLDEVFVRVNGERRYLWRAVDHEGEVLEVYVTKTRDRRAAPVFLKRALKRLGSPSTIVTDQLRSYRAALSELGICDRQDTTRWLNNRAENSHQPFRRRERSMQRFRSDATLQKFVSIHAAIHNHFNLDRHLSPRTVFRQRRDAALSEWRQLTA
jgi:putative transposase